MSDIQITSILKYAIRIIILQKTYHIIRITKCEIDLGSKEFNDQQHSLVALTEVSLLFSCFVNYWMCKDAHEFKMSPRISWETTESLIIHGDDDDSNDGDNSKFT